MNSTVPSATRAGFPRCLNYIGFGPGKSDTKRRHYTGLEVPPMSSGVSDRQFVLQASDLGSLLIGFPVYHRRLQVGQQPSRIHEEREPSGEFPCRPIASQVP